MPALITLTTNASAADSERLENELPAAFSDDAFGQSNIRFISYEGKMIGAVRYTVQDEAVVMALYYVPEAGFEARHRTLSCITETLTARYRPVRLLVKNAVNDLYPVLNACMYYPKGRLYQRKSEPWRFLLAAAVFDREGYIINQGLMENIPFGFFTTKDKGCGWIAVYNLLKINGREITMQETAESLEKLSPLGELMGQNFATMMVWLRMHGIHIRMSMPSDRIAADTMLKTKSGILMYTHKKGAHYAAYRNNFDGTVTLYNAVYGKREHRVKPDLFLKEWSLFKLSIVFYAGQEAR